jgi:TonB-dependent receptor
MKSKALIVEIALVIFLCSQFMGAQNGKGYISGQVKDITGAALTGATVVLEPQTQRIVSDGQGEFQIRELPAGQYTITISYVGFAPYTGKVKVVAGQGTVIEAKLKVASANDDVLVTADRPHGEAEAINRTLAAENILQVLPADVIVSLPNANIADALGRMPSVTIERDEGEGKYVQIRGTEPRLSNTMVDGVTIPSPESGVRQIKLDTIASDLVDSVEINKTLQANIDADGIGGSVNLVTKTAPDQPMVVIYGVGGYTPIIGGRHVDSGGITIGKRFLANKKLGAIAGFTYDYNGRGINDIEPVPDTGYATPLYDSQDMRDYVYNRTRWGVTGSTDYKLGQGSFIAARFLFSTFRNWGNKWVYTLNNGAVPNYSQDWRRPNMAIGSLSFSGHHIWGENTIIWNAAVSRSRSLSGSGGANFPWMGDPNINCVNDQSVAASVNRPGWSAGCFASGADNAFDRNNYGFSEFDYPTYGKSAQLNLEAAGSYARQYHVGTHFGTFEFGAKIRNAHKFDDTYNQSWCTDTSCGGSVLIPIVQNPEWYSNFSDTNYYDKTYGPYPAVTDYSKLRTWVQQNTGGLFLVTNGVFNPPNLLNSSNYDYVERIPAGYGMTTYELTPRIRMVVGLRIEATNLSTTAFDAATNTLSVKGGGDYIDVLPSGSLRFALDKDSDLRVVFGRGLSRPDPQDIAQGASILVKTQTPATVSVGNPELKAEHANDYDILYERNLSHIGLFQAGYFFKYLTDPIINSQTISLTYPGNVGNKTLVSEPLNAGTAHVQGFEVAYQQRLSYLPGVLRNSGISANYSYTQSQAFGVDPLRTDSPALLRQAPNAWNISPTYDTKHFSMRVGMTFDDKMIYAYQYENLSYVYDSAGNPVINPVTGKQETTSNPQVNGTSGPAGDNYLYSHFQFDTQASYTLPLGFQIYAYGLNLNNEVFGFYNGGPQYVVQREHYHPTYAGGIRWNLHHEK